MIHNGPIKITIFIFNILWRAIRKKENFYANTTPHTLFHSYRFVSKYFMNEFFCYVSIFLRDIFSYLSSLSTITKIKNFLKSQDSHWKTLTDTASSRFNPHFYFIDFLSKCFSGDFSFSLITNSFDFLFEKFSDRFFFNS